MLMHPITHSMNELFSNGNVSFRCRLGNTSAYLELREGNETAMRLYGRAGFSEVGRRRRYYENGDTAILMCKDLTIQF